MASAGQAQAHSSQPTHFSRPSGQRLSWCRPWNRGAVTFGSVGYFSVKVLRNIVLNVTPKPAIGSKIPIYATPLVLGPLLLGPLLLGPSVSGARSRGARSGGASSAVALTTPASSGSTWSPVGGTG